MKVTKKWLVKNGDLILYLISLIIMYNVLYICETKKEVEQITLELNEIVEEGNKFHYKQKTIICNLIDYLEKFLLN